jgi:hypothetical protein
MTQSVDLANAINTFVKGCKTDGTWDAIKACCIMAAWDGLDGALYPLKGPAPTNNNFVAGDYNRETGLVGDGSTKWLNSNLAYNSIPSNNEHLAIMRSVAINNGSNAISGGTVTPASFSRIGYFSNFMRFTLQSDGTGTYSGTSTTGFAGASRIASNQLTIRDAGVSTLESFNSTTRSNTFTPYGIFAGNYSDLGTGFYTSARLSFYSIGESLDLALLDNRVSTLMTDIGAAIP